MTEFTIKSNAVGEWAVVQPPAETAENLAATVEVFLAELEQDITASRFNYDAIGRQLKRMWDIRAIMGDYERLVREGKPVPVQFVYKLIREYKEGK
jgi:hypothetical protein